jgi:hypothetical protein
LIPTSTADEIYLSSTPTLINAYYPKSLISLSGTDLYLTVNNTEFNKNVNKDIVYSTATLTKVENNSYSLEFKHIFSLLEIELIQGNIVDGITTWYPNYVAKGDIIISYPYSDVYTLIGNKNQFYFFDGGDTNTFGCIITNDIDGYITINNGVKNLSDKIYLKDLVSSIDAGKIYKLTITVNQHELRVGNLSIEQWTKGSNISIDIIT